MSPYFPETIPHFYEHWETGGNFLDFENEVKRFSQNLANNPDFSVFAKSAGTLVTLKSIYAENIKPKKCVFVGTPVYWANDNQIDFKNWLKGFSIPTLFIQHTNDPTISSKDLRAMLEENRAANYEFVELPGDSHDYPEIEKLSELTSNFINEN